MHDKVKDKIKKLLKLSKDKGATEAEALSAAEKANQLLSEYNISIEELPQSEMTIKHVETNYSYPWVKNVYHWSATLNYCRMLFCPLRGDYQKGAYVFIGKKHNIEVAASTAAYLVKVILRHSRKANKPSAFSYGMTDSICLRLRERYEANKNGKTLDSSTERTALVLSPIYLHEEESNDKYLSSQGIETVTTKVRKRNIDLIDYQRGYAKGKEVEV